MIPAQIVEGPHQRGVGVVIKSIVLKGLKSIHDAREITDSKMKYDIEWSTSIYISKNLIVKILKKIQLVRNYHI